MTAGESRSKITPTAALRAFRLWCSLHFARSNCSNRRNRWSAMASLVSPASTSACGLRLWIWVLIIFRPSDFHACNFGGLGFNEKAKGRPCNIKQSLVF